MKPNEVKSNYASHVSPHAPSCPVRGQTDMRRQFEKGEGVSEAESCESTSLRRPPCRFVACPDMLSETPERRRVFSRRRRQISKPREDAAPWRAGAARSPHGNVTKPSVDLAGPGFDAAVEVDGIVKTGVS